MNINDIESSVLALPERDDVIRREYVCELIMNIDNAQRTLRDAKKKLEAWMIDWLPQVGGELVVGEIRYFVGDKKTVKCRNIPAAVTALYTATEGDFDSFCDCLSVNAIKTGKAKLVLGDRFNEYFETVIEKDLEHKPVKVLVALNDRFVK